MQIDQLSGNLPSFLGVRLYTRPYPTTYVQVRTHKKRRTNKKWRKRYGFKTAVGKYDPYEVLQIGQDFYAYPEGKEKLIEEMTRRNELRALNPEPASFTAHTAPTEPITAESVQKCIDELLAHFPDIPKTPSVFTPFPMRISEPPELKAWWDKYPRKVTT